MWQIKSFSELSTEEFYQIVRLRIAIFVVEQERIYYEVDDRDLTAFHLFHQDEQGQIDAYARIFEMGKELSFGRLVTDPLKRGQGLGSQLVREILKFTSQRYPDRTIHIEAQEQVVGLYKKFGFEIAGSSFIFEGSPHVPMTCTPKFPNKSFPNPSENIVK